jgi:hypothetical protein
MQDTLTRFLTMVRGSLDEKTERLLEEFALKKPNAVNRTEWSSIGEKPSTPQKDQGQKGTDEPWELPGQSSQQPAQEAPPKPDYENPDRTR